MTLRTATRMVGDGPSEFRQGAVAAASLRRLHHAQMAALVVAAACVVAAALLFFQALDRYESRKATVGNAVFLLSRAFEDLRAGQATLEREGARPEVVVRMRDTAVATRELMEAQFDATRDIADAETSRAGAETLATFDRLLERGAPWSRAAGARDRATPLGDDLAPMTERWIAGLQAKRLQLNAQLDATIARSRGVLVGLIVAFALIAVALWTLLGRQRARLVDSLQRTSHEQAAMREMVTAATWAQSFSVADVAAAHIADLVDADQVVVSVDTGDADAHRIAYPSTDLTPIVAATRDAVTARAVTLNEGSVLTDYTGDVTAVCVVGDGPSAACRTVCAVWGPGSAPPDGALETLHRLTETLELAVQAAMARERMATQATTDHLTGLPNHRSFQERLVEEVTRAQDASRPLALVMLDVDAFSNVNDAYGHEAGDRVLAELGLRLRGLSREGDTLARIGGEEFAWLMPGVNAAAARAAADRARGAVRGAALGMASQLTVSAGIVDLTSAQDAKDLLRLAELALRQAKSTGHDAVAVYRPGQVADGEAGERFGRLQTLSAMRALARAVDMRDDNTQRHSERVAALTHRLAVEMGWSPRRASHLQEAALVHDVGKVGVPDAVLLKPGPLTEEERLIIETHPSLGARIVSEILDAEQVAWVRGHHERVDGQGYPDGLSGDDLSQGARIMAAADTWDAMTSDRPYRKALSSDRALEIAIDVAGSQLDADVVAALVRLHRAGVPDTQGHDHNSGFHLSARTDPSDPASGPAPR